MIDLPSRSRSHVKRLQSHLRIIIFAFRVLLVVIFNSVGASTLPCSRPYFWYLNLLHLSLSTTWYRRMESTSIYLLGEVWLSDFLELETAPSSFLLVSRLFQLNALLVDVDCLAVVPGPPLCSFSSLHHIRTEVKILSRSSTAELFRQFSLVDDTEEVVFCPLLSAEIPTAILMFPAVWLSSYRHLTSGGL